MKEHHNSRKTHCRRGHPYNEENTRYTEDGWRDCRVCDRDRARKAKKPTRQAHSTSAECTALLDKLRRHEQYRERTAFANGGTPGSRSGTIEVLIRDACTRLAITVTNDDVAAVIARDPKPERAPDPLADIRAIEEAFGPRFSG